MCVESHACVIVITTKLLPATFKRLRPSCSVPFLRVELILSNDRVAAGYWNDDAYEIDAERADRFPSSILAGDAGLGRGASGRDSRRLRMRFVSREEGHREVGAFGDVDAVHGVSCGENAGRHDDAEPGHAEGTDLLCLP